MKQFKNLLLLIAISTTFWQCSELNEATVASPDGQISIKFELDESGSPSYTVTRGETAIINPSKMGFELEGQEDMMGGFEILNVANSSFSEEWEMQWGEQRIVQNTYNQLTIRLAEKGGAQRPLTIYFKAYDDGIGFRYEFPEQEGVDSLFISEERTEFALNGDHTTYWLPGDWDIYELLYSKSRFSEIDATQMRNHPDLAATYIPVNAVNTPVTMKTDDGMYLSFHEANLTDYSGMTLQVDPENLAMVSNLVGSERNNYKVKRALPFQTPWRTIQISETAGGLIDSKLIVNLNDPNKLGDISWFEPMKYMGIWWEMHLGLSTWDLEGSQSMNTFETGNQEVVGTHGANTENAKRYIDFAAANGIKGLLVEGWYTGWDHWTGFEEREGIFDFVTEYPDYDIEEVVRYGREKGVELIMHHETSAAPRTYEQQLDTAYSLMSSLGIHAVKTGYVGKIIPKGEYHHGQWMVNHYRKVLEHAAANQVAVNAHEPIKATGIRRTYPNAIAREGLRGQEFNAWATDGGNPPEHLSMVAFTRMLGGPIDFTPGIFELSLEPKPDNQINTTLAHQLALYVVIYGPVQMAADLPENYEGHPAFQFIRDVGVNWEQSMTLDGEPGDFVVIAREERETANWFVGAITDENEREITIDFDFLPEGTSFKATVYKDGDEAHYKDNPGDYAIESASISKGDTLSFKLAAGGGVAISLMKE
ncbi:Glycosyl-hydrolase 97 C-terminal, oligomerisation [Robiginitalea myxolifaciens]|uniref:Glycosyl-hydrolase 97 C-terminal, oligomerisation n=1 Tax=Robiginitalea myxolifaciens TaxID=400055 RepID=A0A1I6HB11_9FLAO|nr:glycoside hydrolase family 97 protein [Robiginitalea myxolifaciens]SFR51541.1 Glycosyl-hydrolase 97 C-terminal, oligomerisation [Robiginitalea myxolifaciens]